MAPNHPLNELYMMWLCGMALLNDIGPYMLAICALLAAALAVAFVLDILVKKDGE